MSQAAVMTLVQQTIQVMLLIGAPALAAGLLAGLSVSILQVLTSVNDATLASLPRVVAILLVGYLAFPWMMKILTAYTLQLYQQIPTLIR